jgi:hypothetical protein
VFKAVIKAKGGDFEESKIILDLFNTLLFHVLFHSYDVFYNVEHSKNKEKTLE